MRPNRAQVNEVPKKEPVSLRKTQANRENAKKSTGPRTARGKANSRRNAIKHGLFIRMIDEAFDNEDPREFIDFYNKLRDEKQPVGPSEEREVEYIAICWVRLARLWQYENAEIARANASFMIDLEIKRQGPIDIDTVPGRREFLCTCSAAEKQVEATGQLSTEMMTRIFQQDIFIKMMWERQKTLSEEAVREKIHEIAETVAGERNITLSEAKRMLAENPESNPHFVRAVQLDMIEHFRDQKVREWSYQTREKRKFTRQLHSIPDSAVDKVIRYGNAIERQMSRAYARLERLQARRKGQHVAPILDVHLTS